MVQFITRLVDLLQSPLSLLRRYVVYLYFIRHHRLLGPLSGRRFYIIVIVTIINIFFCAFKVTSVTEARVRTGKMAAINLIPLFFGFHTAFATNILGIRIDLYRFLHVLVSIIYTAHTSIHSVIGIKIAPGSLFKDRVQIYGITVNVLIYFFSLLTAARDLLYLRQSSLYRWRYIGGCYIKSSFGYIRFCRLDLYILSSGISSNQPREKPPSIYTSSRDYFIRPSSSKPLVQFLETLRSGVLTIEPFLY